MESRPNVQETSVDYSYCQDRKIGDRIQLDYGSDPDLTTGTAVMAIEEEEDNGGQPVSTENPVNLIRTLADDIQIFIIEGEDEEPTGDLLIAQAQRDYIIPMLKPFSPKIPSRKTPLRLQQYAAPGFFEGYVRYENYYIDPEDLQNAICSTSSQQYSICVWERIISAPSRFKLKSVIPRDLLDVYKNPGWKLVANRCQKYLSTYHGDYIMARFFDFSQVVKVDLFAVVDKRISHNDFWKCAKVAMTGLNFQPDVWVIHPSQLPGLPDGYTMLGAHPLGLYELYAPSKLIEAFQRNPYPRPVTDARLAEAIAHVAATQTQLDKQADKYAVGHFSSLMLLDQSKGFPTATITTPRKNKLNAATGAKRGVSQKNVMYGHSATEVARLFGWDEPGIPGPHGGLRHRSEWLHRSAFSFGGLGLGADARLNSSQQAKNLVFGSVEANTFMIRPENAIKRLIRKIDQEREQQRRLDLDQPGTVYTITQPLNMGDKGQPIWVRLPNRSPEYTTDYNEDPRNGYRCSWLVNKLIYVITLNVGLVSRNMQDNIEKVIEIDPFSRVVPLRFEAKLDELVEDLWFNSFMG